MRRWLRRDHRGGGSDQTAHDSLAEFHESGACLALVSRGVAHGVDLAVGAEPVRATKTHCGRLSWLLAMAGTSDIPW